jgi:DNA-binding LytR/AlgR family response regulator
MIIDCIIIEDEPIAAKKLADFLKQLEFIQLKASFDNGLDAINYLANHSIDLIFLDIQMKDLNGIQFLNALIHIPKIIITSAYSEYAMIGYEYNVTDYLLKPFGYDRFLKAVNKVYEELNQGTTTSNNAIFIKTEYRIERVDLDDIFYIEGMRDYLLIVTKGKKIMTLLSFNRIMEILPISKFQRVHKSFIIAIDKIESIERNRIKLNNRLIPISETYKNDFINLLKNNNLMI